MPGLRVAVPHAWQYCTYRRAALTLVLVGDQVQFGLWQPLELEVGLSFLNLPILACPIQTFSFSRSDAGV